MFLVAFSIICFTSSFNNIFFHSLFTFFSLNKILHSWLPWYNQPNNGFITNCIWTQFPSTINFIRFRSIQVKVIQNVLPYEIKQIPTVLNVLKNKFLEACHSHITSSTAVYYGSMPVLSLTEPIVLLYVRFKIICTLITDTYHIWWPWYYFS